MFGKKKAPPELCSACDRAIAEGQKVCSCGKGTRYMDFDERRQHEVEQWRAYRARAAAG